MARNLPAPILNTHRLWAIPLSDTAHRTWSLNSQEQATVVFEWDDIDVAGTSNSDDIKIAVAKAYDKVDNRKIKSLASGIYSFSRLKEGDGILGVAAENSVERAGIVLQTTGQREQSRRVEIDIMWLNDVPGAQASKSVFDTGSEIQKVTPGMLNKLDLPVPFREKLHGPSYENSYKAFPIESRFLDDEDIFPEGKEEKGGRITLFYGTNRGRTDNAAANKFYNDEFVDELKFGTCEVSVPRGHVQGEVERPFSIFNLEFPENEQKHVVLKSIKEVNEQDFLSQLADNLGQLEDKAALVFIHGYNTTFAEAARRAAQIAWDVPFNGMTGFYGWPSCGRKLAYLKDIEHANASIPLFEDFIEKIVHHTGVEKLHLIAHSMGSKLLTFTLDRLSSKESFLPKLAVIQQIVLGAPDLDQMVFKNTLLPRLQNIGSRRTLYSSDADKALNLSENLRGGLPRLGDAGSSLFVDNHIDTIDASNVKAFGNKHSYVFDTKELLSDLFYLLNHGFTPIKRRLRARSKDELTYWLFPK